jgi:WD40 repeat protein
VPDWLAAVIAKLQAKDPAERFPSAAAVAELLSKHLAYLQQPALGTLPEATAPAPRPTSRQRHSRRWAAAAAALLVLLLGSGLGLTEATGVTQFAATIVRVLTPDGTLVVEVDDPQVKVTIEGDGGVVIRGAGPQEVRLKPGGYRVQATKDGKRARVDRELVTITRGGTQSVKVSLEPAVQAAAFGPKEPLASGEIRRFSADGLPVTCVAISPDGRRAVFGGEDTMVWLTDLTGKVQPRALVGHTKAVLSVAISPDGRRALSSGMDAAVILWDLESGQEIRHFEGHTEWVRSVAFSPNGRWAVSGGGGHYKDGRWVEAKDNAVRLWDLKTGKQVRGFTGQKSDVLCIAFSPDGRHVLGGGRDAVVRMWDVETGKEVRLFEGHLTLVECVAISRAGDRVLTGSADRTLRLWDGRTGKLLRRFLGHRLDVSGAAFSPDGRYFVSCSWDRTVRLWNVESGDELHRFEGHSESVRGVAFSPNGRSVLSAAEDGTVRLWRFPDP